MSLAGRIDYIIEKDARWYPDVIKWLDSSGNPVNLANYGAKLQIKADKDSSAVLETMSDSFGDLVLGGGTGTIQIDMSGERTRLFTFSRAVFDLLLLPKVGSAIVAGEGYTIAVVEVNPTDGKATIKADGGTPFSTISANDYIGLTGSILNNNGIFKVYSATNTVITLTGILPGSDEVSETLSIQELSNENKVRLAEGYIMLSKGVTT